MISFGTRKIEKKLFKFLELPLINTTAILIANPYTELPE
jgi:hypothetical protein